MHGESGEYGKVPTILSVAGHRLRLNDGLEHRSVPLTEAPLRLATSGTQLVRLERLVGEQIPEAEIHLIGQAALRLSERAAHGYVNWKSSSVRAFICSMSAYSGSAKGLALFHSMRKIADAGGSGRWSFDGVLGVAGHTREAPRLGQALRDAGKQYAYQPVSGTAPSENLLKATRSEPWSRFKNAYHAELSAEEIGRTLFAVAAAGARGLFSVLLCCEPYVAPFDQLSDRTRGLVGCHRFLLAERMATLALELGLPLEVTHLDLSQVARASEGRSE